MCCSGPIYATGLHGLVCRFDGQRWHHVPIGTAENLCGAACRGPTDLWLTTTSGQLLHWNGQQVRTCATLPDGWLDAVYAPDGEDTIYCAGSDGTVLRHHPSDRRAITINECSQNRAVEA